MIRLTCIENMNIHSAIKMMEILTKNNYKVELNNGHVILNMVQFNYNKF